MSENMKKLPEKTIERLSSYRRALLGLSSDGLTHIYSHQLAQIQGITAVQVRRDLMLIGFSSSARCGYDIAVFVRLITSIIDSETPQQVAVGGMGQLAKSIQQYFIPRNAATTHCVATFSSDSISVGTDVFSL